MIFIEHLKETFLSRANPDVKVTFRSDNSNSNNLGSLSGVDLDSSRFAGYIYYWSLGFLDYAVYNIEQDKDEIFWVVKIIYY